MTLKEQNINKLLKNNNFLNNQNYVNSKLQKRMPILNLFFGENFWELGINGFCAYLNEYQKKNLLTLFLIPLFILFVTSWIISYVVDESFDVWRILWKGIFFFIVILLSWLFMSYILLRVAWYDLMKIKVFINFVNWKKYILCKLLEIK